MGEIKSQIMRLMNSRSAKVSTKSEKLTEDGRELCFVAGFKAIIHYKKRKVNTAVPSNVPQLKAQYGETKDRPGLTSKTYLADRGYQGDDVELILIFVWILIKFGVYQLRSI
jgi:hypothetical protein